MKRKSIAIVSALLVILATSCTVPITDIKMNISAIETEVNDSEAVQWTINGDFDILYFYSGEPGHEYKFSKEYDPSSTNPSTATQTLKTFEEFVPEKFSYEYTLPGTYTATFVAKALYKEKSDKKIQEFQIIVK